MRVGLCTRNAQNPVIRLLADKLAAEGHQVDVLTDPRQLTDPTGFDVAFWRPDSRSQEVAAFSRQVPMILEGVGVPFINSLASCDRALNKLVAGRLFEVAGIPTPEIKLMPRHWESESTAELPSGSVIAKPVEGKASRGVTLFPSAHTAFLQLGATAEAYLLQQPINWVQLLRLVMSQAGIVRGFVQENPSGEGEPTITSINGNWPAPATKVSEDAETLALAMLEAVGGDFMRADLLRDAAGKLWALEINASFGFPHDDEIILHEFSRQFGLAAEQRHAFH